MRSSNSIKFAILFNGDDNFDEDEAHYNRASLLIQSVASLELILFSLLPAGK